MNSFFFPLWAALSTLAALLGFLLWRRASERARRLSVATREQKSRLQQELRAAERARRELEDVLASLQDAVLMVDGEARLRFLNAAALQLFEVRIEEVLGAQMLEALPSFGLEEVVRAALEEQRFTTREITLRTPRQREMLLRVCPLRPAAPLAGQQGAVVILQDLTALRHLERVRRDFVVNASHELRTPVANIRALAETIAQTPDDAALATRFFPQIIAEAERLSRLIADLLDLARLESQSEDTLTANGEKASSPPVDLVPIILQVVQQSKYKSLERHIEMDCRFGDGCEHDVLIAASGAALEQVVFNLLDNALMYTTAGGSAEVSLENDKSSDGPRVLLCVRDNGMGIPQGDIERIFERFYRLDKARSRAQGGTGLGLAIVKHIVENLGGHIAVESEEGRGTCFTAALPRQARPGVL